MWYLYWSVYIENIGCWRTCIDLCSNYHTVNITYTEYYLPLLSILYHIKDIVRYFHSLLKNIKKLKLPSNVFYYKTKSKMKCKLFVISVQENHNSKMHFIISILLIYKTQNYIRCLCAVNCLWKKSRIISLFMYQWKTWIIEQMIRQYIKTKGSDFALQQDMIIMVAYFWPLHAR